MTENDVILDRDIAPDKTERKKLRRLYNKVGGAMVLQYFLLYVMYFLLTVLLTPFITEETNPETGLEIVGWAEGFAMYFAPALASVIMFFAFNAVNKVDSRAMFSTRNITAGMLGRFVLMAFAFHTVGMILEYGVDFVLYSTGYEVTSFDYETKNDAATVLTDVVSSVIAAPIAEELFFRGVVLKQTSRVSARFGIIFSAVMFGLMHGNPYQFVMATMIGLFFGYITVKTDSLIPSIVCHIAINGLMSVSDVIGAFSEELADLSYYSIDVIEVILAIIGIWLYKKSGEKATLPPYTEYHKKRTLPIILTSVWVLAVTGLYIYDIVGSVEAAAL